jgi:putative nucleotidyltransferase with HDIG domain
LAREYLDGELLRLFLAQHPRDVVHGIGTARWLLDRGHNDRDLVVVGLVHDVGKGHQRRLDRAAWVLAQRTGRTKTLASRESRFELLRAAARTAKHSQSGAELLRAAGASERVVDLTRRHHEPHGNDPVLALLQQADAAS